MYVKDTVVVNSGGTDMSVKWSLKLKPTMARRDLYGWLLAVDSGGLQDGYRKLGTYPALYPPICVVAMPNTGTVKTGTAQIFSTGFVDDHGCGDLSKCYLQLSVTSSQANAVLLMYDAVANKVYLKNDANSSWGTGYTPGAAATLQNSQCIVDVRNTQVYNSGKTWIVIDWSVSLKAGQAGKKLVERMYALDKHSLNSGWQVMGMVLAN